MGISIVTVFVLVSVVFFLARLMPGGPFNDPKMSATAKANLSAYYGFDKPLLQQYLTYLNNLIHGNFGFSTKYPSRTVNDLLAGAFPYSADLGIRALCFAISFGLVFGIISALNRGNKIDLIFVIVAVFGTSVPDFIMGALLQHFFAVNGGCSRSRSTRASPTRSCRRSDWDSTRWHPSRVSCVRVCWR